MRSDLARCRHRSRMNESSCTNWRAIIAWVRARRPAGHYEIADLSAIARQTLSARASVRDRLQTRRELISASAGPQGTFTSAPRMRKGEEEVRVLSSPKFAPGCGSRSTTPAEADRRRWGCRFQVQRMEHHRGANVTWPERVVEKVGRCRLAWPMALPSWRGDDREHREGAEPARRCRARAR
jgi:hypothetical protein